MSRKDSKYKVHKTIYQKKKKKRYIIPPSEYVSNSNCKISVHPVKKPEK